mmetsp:Transcript_49164/g.55710  ORF Transcript_49164/g.55710 Transcript_49164/m.55710 type:complete len:101 (-) Transcript_49164:130-432(-)
MHLDVLKFKYCSIRMSIHSFCSATRTTKNTNRIFRNYRYTKRSISLLDIPTTKAIRSLPTKKRPRTLLYVNYYDSGQEQSTIYPISVHFSLFFSHANDNI